MEIARALLLNRTVLLSPQTPRHSPTPTNDGSFLQTPTSSRRRKVARTPSKLKSEETETFDSLLESFVLELQDDSRTAGYGEDLHLVTSTFSTAASLSGYGSHRDESHSNTGSSRFNEVPDGQTTFLHSTPIKLEELFSDCESTDIGEGE